MMNAENEWERPRRSEPFVVNEPLAVIHGRGCLPGTETEGEGKALEGPPARVVARWKNTAGETSHTRFSLSLLVASEDRDHPVRATFLFDTGASTTLVSPSLARILGLQPRRDAPVELRSIVGTAWHGHRSEIAVLVGSEWLRLPCFVLVASGSRPAEPMPNVLGMEGLLDRYVFRFGPDELCLLGPEAK
jgi:hypothetical protein